MKLRYLAILFIIVVVIILSIIILLPLLITIGQPGGNQDPIEAYAKNIRFMFIPLIIFMFLLLSSVCIYLFHNYRLFSLLEREDWPALAYYLENKIFVKGKFSTKYVRLLASSYLVISDFQSVLNLESKTQAVKPAEIPKNVLLFGSARILGGNYAEAASFFNSQIDKCKPADKEWVRWFGCFSLLLSGSFKDAEPEFLNLAETSGNAVITGLSAYFLHSSLEKKSQNAAKCGEVSKTGKSRVISALKNVKSWDKEIAKMGTDIHIAIIKKYVDEVRQWIFFG